MSEERRYFVDHGTIHDRVTGKHVDLDEAAELLSVEPESLQRIAWGVVVRLGAALKNAEVDRDSLQAELAEARGEIERLRKVYEAAKTWCETVYIGKPHPRYPAYPGDELLHAVNAVKFASRESEEG